MYRFSQLVHTMKWSPLPQGLTRILLSNQGILENTKRSAPKDNVLLFPSAPAHEARFYASVACRERLGGLLKYYHREAA